ncbi:MAG: TIGR03067 domain-containing protein [Verrucomicrobia bacterium]|nr:TIGR03067 domain-containing protein [Verrucomicrobiota bacterium]
MTHQRRLVLALLILVFTAALWFLLSRAHRDIRSAAPATTGRSAMTRAERLELEKLQGPWKFVSLEVEGDRKPENDFGKYSVVFKGDQWIVSEGARVAAQTTVVLDPSTNPKSLDAFPPPGKGQPIHGIYLLEGDKLTICDRGEDTGERPTEFSSEPNSGLVLIVYKRGHD